MLYSLLLPTDADTAPHAWAHVVPPEPTMPPPPPPVMPPGSPSPIGDPVTVPAPPPSGPATPMPG